MENYITILLIAGGLIFKVYSEFQKEKKIAAERKTNMPKGPQPSAIPIPTVKPSKMVNSKPPVPAMVNRPSIKPVKLPAVPQLTKKSLIKHNTFEKTSLKAPGPIDSARRQPLKRATAKPLKLTPLAVEVIHVAPQFDLREAIIYKAILERPFTQQSNTHF